MAKTTFVLWRIHISAVLLALLLHVNSQLYDEEHAVLLRMKQHWQDPPSISHWSAPPPSDHCTWPEVTCADNSVTKLSLIRKNITKAVPPFICDLKNLSFIDLQYNFIPGNFPQALYDCAKLKHLDLSQNYFVGPIPEDINRLKQLGYLNLAANNLSGDIPASIGRLSSLTSLQLHQNQFNGTFPPEIGDLSELEVLNLAFNTKFRPSRLHTSFAKLRKLKELRVLESNLVGEIPERIGDMESLEFLDLSTNRLTGKIPDGLFMLKNLSILYLYKNRLSGDIPEIVEAANLIEFDLSENHLTGNIPDSVQKLERLSSLVLFSNDFSGKVPQGISKLPELIDVRLFNNSLSGVLPPEFGKYSMLEAFEVSENRFTGKLPENLCLNRKLKGVVAFSNNLTGELPDSLGECSSLVTVMIYNNSFSGKVPVGLWTSQNLLTLMINDNSFTGQLPDKVSPSLTLIEISNNGFWGKIPVEVNISWSNVVVFKASDNMLNGIIPKELTYLPSLTTLLLDGNQLSGSIPSDIVSWKSLTSLNLSGNELSGKVSPDIGRLPILNSLDLSRNQLSGQIPSEIGLLKPTSLNLSSNNFSGRIPDAFENAAYSESFLNNPSLCSDIPQVNLDACESRLQRPKKNPNHGLAWIAGILIVSFSVPSLLVSCFAIRFYCRRKRQINSSWKLTSFQRVSFTESDILSELKDSNVIGEGGSGRVYRVALTPSDFLAVKELTNAIPNPRLENQFLSEIQTLSSIRHSNIIRLLCCVWGPDSKLLLVYEFMENGSLYECLHRRRKAMLDWPTRLHVAIGAAEGIRYMHHECSPRVVHGDVKSSNILLGSEFRAKVSDFGLARVLVEPGEASAASTVAGAFGYMAPEYAHTTKLNEKVDVFGFGVILLELTTGREANCRKNDISLYEWGWHYIRANKQIPEALDKSVKEPRYTRQMEDVFKLGLHCTSLNPTDRPSMKEAAGILIRIRDYKPNREEKDGMEHDVAPLLEFDSVKRSS